MIQQPGYAMGYERYEDMEELRSDWANFELALEGHPSPGDLLVERVAGQWEGSLAREEEKAVLTGFHSLEELIPAALRYLGSHGIKTGNIWVKEEGQLFLLDA